MFSIFRLIYDALVIEFDLNKLHNNKSVVGRLQCTHMAIMFIWHQAGKIRVESYVNIRDKNNYNLYNNV